MTTLASGTHRNELTIWCETSKFVPQHNSLYAHLDHMEITSTDSRRSDLDEFPWFIRDFAIDDLNLALMACDCEHLDKLSL
jgi:hypothetical protein